MNVQAKLVLLAVVWSISGYIGMMGMLGESNAWRTRMTDYSDEEFVYKCNKDKGFFALLNGITGPAGLVISFALTGGWQDGLTSSCNRSEEMKRVEKLKK
jgi:hypothetical protein